VSAPSSHTGWPRWPEGFEPGSCPVFVAMLLGVVLALGATASAAGGEKRHSVENAAKEGAKTGGRTAKEGVLTFGRSAKAFFTGGPEAAKDAWKAGAAKTKRTAKVGARETKRAAKGE
jgi:hypothetical protein